MQKSLVFSIDCTTIWRVIINAQILSIFNWSCKPLEVSLLNANTSVFLIEDTNYIAIGSVFAKCKNPRQSHLIIYTIGSVLGSRKHRVYCRKVWTSSKFSLRPLDNGCEWYPVVLCHDWQWWALTHWSIINEVNVSVNNVVH